MLSDKPHLSYIDFHARPVWVYDMEIKDVKERFAKRQYFETVKDVANMLGIPPNKIFDRIGEGKYAYHKETKHKYAIRNAK